MTWIEKIEAAKLRRNDTAGECMAMIQALAAERDELQAQVAVLRGALEEVGKGHIESRFDHEDGRFVEVFVRDVHIGIGQALEQTSAEAAERVQKLVEALEDCRNLISKTEFPTVAEQADNALSEWRHDKCS